MSIEQGTKFRDGKIIDFPPKMHTIIHSAMTDLNPAYSDFNDNSDISSQLTEIRENYEWKINYLQAEISQLNDLMMPLINKPNEDSPPDSSQGSSKQSRSRLDIRLGSSLAECHIRYLRLLD